MEKIILTHSALPFGNLSVVRANLQTFKEILKSFPFSVNFILYLAFLRCSGICALKNHKPGERGDVLLQTNCTYQLE